MGTITKQILERFTPNRQTYIETGTYMGASAKVAVVVGFKNVHTVDINKDYSKYAPSGSTFHHGRSVDVLPELIKEVDKSEESVVFFLDGHTNSGEKTPDAYPLIWELSIIKQAKRNDHVIIIDDMYHMWRCFKDGPSIEESIKRIQDIILSINESYEFEFFDKQKKYKNFKFMTSQVIKE